MNRPQSVSSFTALTDYDSYVLNNLYDPDYGAVTGSTATLFNRMCASYNVFRVVAARISVTMYCENMTNQNAVFNPTTVAEALVPHHAWLVLNDSASTSGLMGDCQYTVPQSEYVRHQQFTCPSLTQALEPGCHCRLVAWYSPRKFWKGLATKQEQEGASPSWTPMKRCFAHLVFNVANYDISLATYWPKWMGYVKIDFWAKWYDGDPTEPPTADDEDIDPSQLTQD